MLLEKIWPKFKSPNEKCAPWGSFGPNQTHAAGGFCAYFGETKYFVNQTVYNQGWGRNQNDGPAFNSL
eukprot:3591897-Heterocapsa_arctica.AAC.1